MKMNRVLPLITLLLPLFAGAATTSSNDMAGMKHADESKLSASSQAYLGSMGRMHDEMMAGVKANDPDVAFARGMIAHHKGAIEMAKTELQYGKDPKMRLLAENVIKAQEAEITTMQQWLSAHPDTK